MRFFDAEATRAALPFERLIPVLRALFATGCEVPARQVLEIASPAHEPMTSLVMPAWVAGGHYGVKIVNVAPANAARGLYAAGFLGAFEGGFQLAGVGDPFALGTVERAIEQIRRGQSGRGRFPDGFGSELESADVRRRREAESDRRSRWRDVEPSPGAADGEEE